MITGFLDKERKDSCIMLIRALRTCAVIAEAASSAIEAAADVAETYSGDSAIASVIEERNELLTENSRLNASASAEVANLRKELEDLNFRLAKEIAENKNARHYAATWLAVAEALGVGADSHPTLCVRKVRNGRHDMAVVKAIAEELKMPLGLAPESYRNEVRRIWQANSAINKAS